MIKEFFNTAKCLVNLSKDARHEIKKLIVDAVRHKKDVYDFSFELNPVLHMPMPKTVDPNGVNRTLAITAMYVFCPAYDDVFEEDEDAEIRIRLVVKNESDVEFAYEPNDVQLVYLYDVAEQIIKNYVTDDEAQQDMLLRLYNIKEKLRIACSDAIHAIGTQRIDLNLRDMLPKYRLYTSIAPTNNDYATIKIEHLMRDHNTNMYALYGTRILNAVRETCRVDLLMDPIDLANAIVAIIFYTPERYSASTFGDMNVIFKMACSAGKLSETYKNIILLELTKNFIEFFDMPDGVQNLVFLHNAKRLAVERVRSDYGGKINAKLRDAYMSYVDAVMDMAMEKLANEYTY